MFNFAVVLELTLTVVLIITQFCTVSVYTEDGNWSEWTEWQPCPVTCGEGTRKRYRHCDNPRPTNGGSWCRGKHKEEELCAIPECPVNGGWGQWSTWTACTVSCGEGTSFRFRECDSPRPNKIGKDCEGTNSEMIQCYAMQACPRDGGWSSWSDWSGCSVTCGNGEIYRYRSCNNPSPQGDGRPCVGKKKEVRPCGREKICPVNGQWSEWSQWSPCSVTCGAGIRGRSRLCDNPPPQNSGKPCSTQQAGAIQERSCNGSVIFCPVDGGWSDWREWGACTTQCADKNPNKLSYRFRERRCDRPHPSHKGSMCQGTFLDSQLCEKATNCQVDGGWSQWSEWTCTKFVAIRTRTCDNPKPSNGGKDCKSPAEEVFTHDEPEYADHCPDFVGEADDYDEIVSSTESNEGNNEKKIEEEEEYNYEDNFDW